MAMPQREVKVGDHRYKFYLIGGRKAFEATRRFTAKTTALAPCLTQGKVEEFNSKFYELMMEDFVIMENDKDFFQSLPSLIEKGLHHLNERLQANSLPKAEGLETAMNSIANKMKENLG